MHDIAQGHDQAMRYHLQGHTMASNQQEWVLPNGLNVVGSDNEKIGEVEDALGDYFTIKKSWLFGREYYVPATAIATVDDSAVYLNVTRDEALHQGWDQVPGESTTAYDDTPGGSAAGDSSIMDTESGLPQTGGSTGEKQPFDHAVSDGARHEDDSDMIRVPLSEEKLTATRRQADRGAVRVERNVVEKEQTLDVPTTEENVHVIRRTVDRDATRGDTLFQNGTIEIPIRGEEVDVEKHARIVEELEISREAVQRTRHVTDTVHREEARVVDTTGTLGDDQQSDTVNTADHRSRTR
jgi:uncharacterized protein (TIGR02271 family)